MSTLDLRGSTGTLRLATNGGNATIRPFVGVGPAGPPGTGGTGGTGGTTSTPVIGVDTDGIPYYEAAGVSGGTSVQTDTDGVPYFV